jgi:putative ABC transport system permease protein
MIVTIIQLALREIRANLMRSILTALGIIIGVAAVIIMVTLGSGASASVISDFEALGRNLLVVYPGTERRNAGTLTTDAPFEGSDLLAVEREVRDIDAIAPNLNRAATAVYGSENRPTIVTGTDNAFFRVRDWDLDKGRPFTEGELRSGKGVCILGETVRQALFGAQDPMDANIRVGSMSCEVIGLLHPKGQWTSGQDQDDLILMPLRTVQRRIAGTRDVGLFWISATATEHMHKVQQDVRAVLRERRKVPLGNEDDFVVRDFREISEAIAQTTATLTAFLGAVAAVSLLVGGIGIMNIMLVSVTERTREIGIRLAIGARERDVLLQFLIEAVIIASLGGMIGIAIGLGGSAALAPMLGIPFLLDLSIVVFAFFFSAAVGIAFGFFPSRRAARLDPIEALRYE